MSDWLVSATTGWCAIAGMLAALAAGAELVGRYKDAPGRALRSTPGIAYLSLNGLLAALVLVALRYGNMPQNHFTIAEQVFLSCLVARIVVRTRITGLKSADGVVTETGPGQFFEKMLTAITRQLAREKANLRLRNVSEQLVGVDYGNAFGFFVSELMAAQQDLTDEDKRDIGEALAVIDARKDLDDSTRVDMLGFLVLDYGGQDFLDQLVKLYFVRFPRRPLPSTAVRAA